MATIRGPRIVNNGLILCLDAADRKSYSGSGTAWNDLSGNNFSITLSPTVGGPTFTSTNGGAIVFDGSNDYGSLSLNLTGYTEITTEIWLKPNVSTQAMAFEHSTNWNVNLGAFGLYPNSNGSSSNSGLCHTTFSGGQRNYAFTCGTTNYSCHTNIFCNTFDSTGRLVYVNGNLLPFSSVGGYSTSTATSVGSPFTNYPMYLASRAGTSQFFNTNIAIFRIYNRKLTASEVLQNFNAQRGRFGI